MLELGAETRVYLYTGKTDMRCGSNRLQELVRAYFLREAYDGNVYAFVSRDRKKVKLLYWERSGFWLMYKRLETSTFRIQLTEEGREELTGVDLLELLKGVDIRTVRLTKKINERVHKERAM